MKVRAVLGPLLAAAVALSAAACGDSASSSAVAEPAAEGASAGPSSAAPVHVNMAALSIGQVAPIVLGKQKGIFAKHGIDLNIAFLEPPALVPTLLSGKADFIWSNPPALLAARGNNVPIKSVTTVSTAGSDPSTFPIQVLVPKGSPITSLGDLVGKKVATASLFQLPDLALTESLDEAGKDGKSVKYVEIPFPNMAQALGTKQIDAAISTEPFVTIAKASGNVVPLASVSEGLAPTTPISAIASSEKYISGNPKVVEEFRSAVDELSAYARDHEDEVRAVIPTITKITPELAKVIKLAPIDTKDDAAAWGAWADLLVKVGVLKTKPDASEAFLAD